MARMTRARVEGAARRWWRSVVLERYFGALKRYWAKKMQKYAAIAHWHRVELRRLFRTWAENVVFSAKELRAINKTGNLRADFFAGQAASIEREKQDLEARLRREQAEAEETERRRIAEKRAADDLWAEQKLAAWEKGENRRKRKMQEIEWRRQREEAERHERAKERKMWKRMRDHIAQDAEDEAIAFLATKAGRELLHFRTQQVRREGGLREDQVANGLSTELEEGQDAEEYNQRILLEAMTTGAEYVKLFDPLFDEAFFYNCRTGERLTAEDMSYEEAKSVARETFIKESVTRSLAESDEARRKDIQDRKEYAAAVKISNMMRRAYFRGKLRRMTMRIYVTRNDPTTGDMYFYNTWNGKSRWDAPRAIRGKKFHLPEWIVLRDPESQRPYYRQTIDPLETTWQKPPGWLPCCVCRVEFATRRCLDCKSIYCIDCHEAYHPNPTFVPVIGSSCTPASASTSILISVRATIPGSSSTPFVYPAAPLRTVSKADLPGP